MAAGSQQNRTDWGRRYLQAAWALWVVLAVAVSVKALVQPDRRTCYTVYEMGSRSWWIDGPIYHANSDYLYPPTFSIAISPLTVLPTEAGGLLWNLLCLLVAVVGLKALMRDVLPGNWSPARRAALVALVALGVTRGVWAAQANTLILGMAMLTASCITRRRWWPAAALLAGMTFIKMWPLALALLLMACWPKRLIGRFAVSIGALAAVPLLTQTWSVVWSQYEAYGGMLLARRVQRFDGSRDLWTVWEQFGQVDTRVYLVLQLVAAVGVLAWCLWLQRRARTQQTLLMGILCSWTAWQLTVGPGTERLTFSIVAPFLSWAVLTSIHRGRQRLSSHAAWWLVTIFGLGAVERALRPLLFFAPALKPIGVLVFAVWIAFHPWHEEERDEVAEPEDRSPGDEMPSASGEEVRAQAA